MYSSTSYNLFDSISLRPACLTILAGDPAMQTLSGELLPTQELAPIMTLFQIVTPYWR